MTEHSTEVADEVSAVPEAPAAAPATQAADAGPTQSSNDPHKDAAKPTAAKKKTWRYLLRTAILFALAVLVTYQLEHYAESILLHGEEPHGVSQTVFGVSGAYKFLVSGASSVSRRTIVVPIDSAADATAVGLGGNLCEQRKYIADLLEAFNEEGAVKPTAIVFDYSFAPNACPTYGKNDPTPRLVETFRKVSQSIPIVVAVAAQPAQAPREGVVGEVLPTLNFGKRVHEGIANLTSDSNQIPLGWKVFNVERQDESWYSSLAIEGAASVESEIFNKNRSLQPMIEDGKSPYMNLIPPGAMDLIFSGEFICNSQKKAAYAAACARIAKQKVEGAKDQLGWRKGRNYAAGKIVVVGQRSLDVDRHFTAIGNISGLELQASAIEAILANHYFTPVRWEVNLILGFLLFASVHLALSLEKTPVALAAFVLVLAVFGAIVVVAARISYTFIAPAAGLLAMALKFIGWIGERIAKLGEGDD